MCGSYDELFTVERQQKPILAIVKGGIEKLPGWLFSFMKPKNIFSSAEECVEYLYRVNNGEEDLDKEWVLINAK